MIIDLNPTESNPSPVAVNPAPESQPAATGLLVAAPKRQRPRGSKVRAAVCGGVQGALIVTALAVATSAQGSVEATWNGGSEGAPNAWGNTNNWVGGSVPQSSDTAVFGSPVNSYTVDLGGGSASADTVSINSSVSYQFLNGSLGLGSGVQVLQGPHTMDCDVDLLGSTSDWSIASGANLLVNGQIHGSTLQKSGNGTLTLAGANAYTGGTVIAAGTLAISEDSNLGDGSLAFGGSATLRILSTFSTAKAIGLGSLQNFIEVNGGQTLTVNGVVTGSTGTFQKSGNGTLELTGSNTFSADIALNLGTLRISSDDNLGNSANTLYLGGPGTLEATSSLALNRTVNFAGGTVSVPTGTTLTLASNVTGSGAVVKTGVGTLELSGGSSINDSSSATEFDVTAGTLLVNSSLSNAPIVVSGSAVLAGGGSTAGNVSILAGGVISPGNSAGTFNVGGSLTNGGTYLCELNGESGDNLVVSSNLDLAGSTLNLQVLGSLTTNFYIIATYGTRTGTFDTISNLPPDFIVDYAYSYGGNSNNIAVVYFPLVPPLTFGNALSFNGVDQYVSITNFGAIAPTKEVTVEFWTYTPTNTIQSVFGLSPDIGDTNRIRAHIHWVNTNTYWDFGNLTTSGRLSYPSPAGTLSNWQHYALVASSNGNFMAIYRNGVLETNKTGMTPFVRGNYELRLGGSDNDFLNGQLDEFRVWNTARTANEIAANYNHTLKGNEPGLLLYYRFDETGGTVVTNSAATTGSAYNGTLVNAPTWTPSGAPIYFIDGSLNIIDAIAVNATGDVYLGSNGPNTSLLITNSGMFTNAGHAYLGVLATSSNNLAVVTGTNSLWTSSGNLLVGNNSAGNQLLVSAGGAVANAFGILGNSSIANSNLAVVTGAGSLWTNSSGMYAGYSSSGNQLVVSNGAVVATSFGGVGINPTASNNLAVVTGAGSLWANSNDIVVGSSGKGNQLVVGDGGTVQAANAYVGANSIDNRVTVSGGNLIVTNSGGTGTLNILRGTNVLNAGLIQTDNLLLNNGALGRFEFNGGTLITRGSTVNNGQAFVVGNGSSGATYQLNGNGLHTFSDGLVISTAATLTGEGTVAGPITIQSGGNLSPNAPVGLLVLSNSPVLQGSVLMQVSVKGIVHTNNQIQVAASLTYGGNLVVSKLGPDALAIGDSIQLFSATSYGGAFTGMSLPSPGSGLMWTNQLLLNGSIAVVPQVQPSINGLVKSGTNLVFNVSGGSPGGAYTLLTSTNVALPLSSWTTNSTGNFDWMGNITLTNGINPNEAQRYFNIRVP